MKTELIAKLEELLEKDAGEIGPDVRALQKEYQKLWTIEFEKTKQEFVNEGGHAKEYAYTRQPDDLKFEALIEKYNKLKKESDAKIAAEQSKNLLIRQEIIAKIKDLSRLSENVGTAVRKLQELQTQWKETGPVSPHKYKEMQAEYSKALEDIYYNLKIFRDLQEHDLRKNFENKTQLVGKLRDLLLNENIKEVERLIKMYRNDWDEIGPVPYMKWDALKQDYKAVLEEVYSKLKGYYHSVEEQKEQNLKLKKEIIEKIREIIEGAGEAKASKWNELGEKIILLQAEWKSIGRTSEKDNEKIWTEFRALCDSFFERKKEFFTSLNEKFAANRKIKAELIAKAESLQNSTDWQKTGQELMKLQDEWKKYQSNGDKEEPKLFTRFRKACNAFFEAKKDHYESIDASYKQNLVAKEAILTRFNEYKLGDDSDANRKALMDFSDEWTAAGLVPLKDKKRINDAFYNRMDELYSMMNIDKHEKAMMQFRIKIDRLASSDQGFELLRKESDHLKKIMDEINGQVRTYENNLGFFKSSKGSGNALMKEVEEKIEAEKKKSATLAAKRKLIGEELAKLRSTDKQKAEV